MIFQTEDILRTDFGDVPAPDRIAELARSLPREPRWWPASAFWRRRHRAALQEMAAAEKRVKVAMREAFGAGGW